MKLDGAAAADLSARPTITGDTGSERDGRERGPEFEAALAKLRERALQTSGDDPGSDQLSSGARSDMGQRKARSHPSHHDHSELISEDQLLCATSNNPVIAALAARTWALPTHTPEVTRADGLAQELVFGAVQESVAARAAGAYVGSSHASNLRQSDDTLTEKLPSAAVGALTSDDHERTIHDAGASSAHSQSVSGNADFEAEILTISAQMATSPALDGQALVAAKEVAPSANVPSLPLATAERMIAGTLAALRIDRDTDNPQLSTSILEVRHPELGVVRAEVRMHGDSMEVRFEATTAAALLLRASESVLRKAVSQHGLRLRNLQIDTRSTLLQERSRRARRHLLDLEA